VALQAVLSAMREIILDAPLLSSDSATRLADFKKRFPKLSLAEIEDLSKTPIVFSLEKGI
jgi:hypothetical protein